MSTPIMNQYNKIKKENPESLLFFRLGDFYELFYEDAKIAAKELQITLTKRSNKNEDIPMAGVPYHTSDFYIAKLIKAGYRIAICEQIGSQLNEQKIIERKVTQIITPGTLTNETMLEAKRNNFLISIEISQLSASIAALDLSTNEFFIEEIEKTQLKNYIEKINPSEILISQNFVTQLIDAGINKNQITIIQTITKFHAENIIMQFFQLHTNQSIAYLNINNQIAVATILEYIQYTQKNNKLNFQLPQKIIENDNVTLDIFTRRNLEITKTLQNNFNGSLLSFIDQTLTPQGGRKIFKLLTNPINNIETLNKRYDNIEYFLNNKENFQLTQKILPTLPDFERVLNKILINKATPQQILQIANGSLNLCKLCDNLNKSIPKHHDIWHEILSAIEETAPNTLSSDEYYIKKDYSHELDEWKNFHKDIYNQIEILQTQYQNITKIPSLKIKKTPLGFLIEINSNYKEKLNYNFEIRQSLKTSIRYSTNDLDTINSKYAQSTDFIKQKEEEILSNLCEKIKTIAEDVLLYSEISAFIDTYSNLAKIAQEFSHTRPILTENNEFEITEGKHPTLEKLFQKEGNTFVSNDCNLQQPIMFLTGPNMAGKSTYLRQQAIICLLAHCGMFVPCEKAIIGIVDQIFSRISTNDDILQGKSTFMTEMIELSLTMNLATPKSFLILDEIGRGTSVEEGIALAHAILNHLLTTLKARVFFSTHYISLSTIDHTNMQKKMMSINLNPLTFTYKIIDGVANKSYAIEVAKMAGMPSIILKNAINILNQDMKK